MYKIKSNKELFGKFYGKVNQLSQDNPKINLLRQSLLNRLNFVIYIYKEKDSTIINFLNTESKKNLDFLFFNVMTSEELEEYFEIIPNLLPITILINKYGKIQNYIYGNNLEKLEDIVNLNKFAIDYSSRRENIQIARNLNGVSTATLILAIIAGLKSVPSSPYDQNSEATYHSTANFCEKIKKKKNYIKIGGPISLTYLKIDNKDVFLFGDVHTPYGDNVSNCYISYFLENMYVNNPKTKYIFNIESSGKIDSPNSNYEVNTLKHELDFIKKCLEPELPNETIRESTCHTNLTYNLFDIRSKIINELDLKKLPDLIDEFLEFTSKDSGFTRKSWMKRENITYKNIFCYFVGGMLINEDRLEDDYKDFVYKMIKSVDTKFDIKKKQKIEDNIKTFISQDNLFAKFNIITKKQKIEDNIKTFISEDELFIEHLKIFVSKFIKIMKDYLILKKISFDKFYDFIKKFCNYIVDDTNFGGTKYLGAYAYVMDIYFLTKFVFIDMEEKESCKSIVYAGNNHIKIYKTFLEKYYNIKTENIKQFDGIRKEKAICISFDIVKKFGDNTKWLKNYLPSYTSDD